MSNHESMTRIRGFIPMAKFTCRLILEICKGLYRFRHLPDTVTIYGSARLKPDHPYYQQAQELGKKLANAGIEIMTGGGPGIMEAANKGAYLASGKSHACNIILPFEQKQNPYVSTAYQAEFFFIRKFLLRHSSKALVAFPGGFGTLDELFESLTLIRTNCVPTIPTILIGSEYWSGLIQYLKETQVPLGTISEDDLSQLQVTDDLDEALQIIETAIHG